MMLGEWDSELTPEVAAGTAPSTTCEWHQPGCALQVPPEIEPAGPFFYAEEYHQQYLHKVPNGYCGLTGTGVACQVPVAFE